MKNTIVLFILIALAMPTFAHVPTPDCDLLGRVTLTAGTLVVLETDEKILSDEVTVGQVLKFKVKSDVVAEGEVVIKTGVIALGRVKEITKTTYNLPEKITIELTSVKAVDGQQIALNGTEQTFKGKFTGEGTFIQVGKTITGNVMNDTIIQL